MEKGALYCEHPILYYNLEFAYALMQPDATKMLADSCNLKPAMPFYVRGKWHMGMLATRTYMSGEYTYSGHVVMGRRTTKFMSHPVVLLPN